MNTLLAVVAVLAIAGGITIVAVTSPQSWEMGPAAWLQGQTASPTAPGPASATPVPPTPTLEPTAAPSATLPPPTDTLPPPTDTAAPSPEATSEVTPTVEATPTVALSDLPDDVRGLAIVRVDGGALARVRNGPAGPTVVTAVPDGTEVQVLFGGEQVGDVLWLPVRLAGASGWMASFLLEFTQERAAP